jgi:hypothetical protein
VKLEDGEADPIQGGFGSGELLQDLHAQARLLHHSTNPADLPFNPIEPGDDGLLLLCVQH